jgi:hypothetical protein
MDSSIKTINNMDLKVELESAISENETLKKDLTALHDEVKQWEEDTKKKQQEFQLKNQKLSKDIAASDSKVNTLKDLIIKSK